jgi:hypothetical protein
LVAVSVQRDPERLHFAGGIVDDPNDKTLGCPSPQRPAENCSELLRIAQLSLAWIGLLVI